MQELHVLTEQHRAAMQPPVVLVVLPGERSGTPRYSHPNTTHTLAHTATAPATAIATAAHLASIAAELWRCSSRSSTRSSLRDAPMSAPLERHRRSLAWRYV